MHETWAWLIVPDIYRIEWVYLACLVLLSCLLPRRSATLQALSRGISWVGNRKSLAIICVVFCVLVGRLALIGDLGIPKAGIADEFGYLLTADTFAHGRMSNPTPPIWKPLETIHVFHTPTYQSQYPIGYPAVLALAQVLVRNPWWAVYLVTALMCGAITWMLQAWLPPRWALIGGLFVAIRFGLFSYWMNSFWGGSLAALGGALVFGALPRITSKFGRSRVSHRGPVLLHGILLALGVAILATTRPFEGFVLCLPVAAVLGYWLLCQRGSSLRFAIRNVVLPCALILSSTAAINVYYQYRVTGSALQTPYSVAFKQFHVSPPFVFQKNLPTPHYDFVEMRLVYLHYELREANDIHDPYGLLGTIKQRATWYWQFYVTPLMTLPLIASVITIHYNRKLELPWLTVVLFAIGILFENYVQVHYLAPCFCIYVLLLLSGARQLRLLRIHKYHLGLRLVRPLPFVCIIIFAFRVFAFHEADPGIANHWPPNWAYSTSRVYYRDQVEDKLNAVPGQHLVFVRYRYPFHRFYEEVVYNGADLDDSKIIWARSQDVSSNCSFALANASRRFWVYDEWGDVLKFSAETQADICDRRNPVYEPNHPFEYYSTGEIFRARLRELKATENAVR